MRLSIEAFVHWGISTAAAFLVRTAISVLARLSHGLQNSLQLAKWLLKVVVRLQGVIGLASLSFAWLSMHVVLGGLAAAALAAHDTVVFGLLELRQAPDYLPLLLDVPCHVHASLLEVQ